MADGTTALWFLLKSNAGLTDTVPADRITSGVIPQGSTLPAIGLNHVSTVRRNGVKGGEDAYCVERVQVTVFAATYPNLRAVMALVRGAVSRKPGVVNGTKVDSILTDLEGPDFRDDEAGIYARSQDFIVNFNE